MDVKVELLKFPTDEDWLLMKKCTLVTVSKDSEILPTEEWKKKLLRARHSPIRELKYVFRIENLPYWIAMHLRTHHVGFQCYISTQRNDRQNNYDRNAARQDSPVSMIISLNAESLMTLANKRLCKNAAEETREVVQKMCNVASYYTPEIADFLVPICRYHGGICHELKPCYENLTRLCQTKEQD